MGAERGTRCTLHAADHGVSDEVPVDEVPVVKATESRDQGLWRLKCFTSMITRQGQPGAPYEHEPLALPLATEDQRNCIYCLTGRRVWVYVGAQCSVTGLSLAKTERSPSPHKGSSEKATSTGVSSSKRVYGFQMLKMAAMPSKQATTQPQLIRLEV